MLDFKSIETFLWVVKLGSFRSAAQRMNTTQPAISQRIAQLEREMGVRLLNRDHRVASPTPSGRQMLVYAEKLIGLRAEMMTEICESSAVRGVLRLGVAETIVHTWFPQLVKSVNELYPNLSLEIEVDITTNLSARLLAQEIELGLVVGPLSSAGVQSLVLRDYDIGFLASPTLGLGKAALTRRDLARYPMITFPRKTRPYEAVRGVFDRPDRPPTRLKPGACGGTVIHMAVEGAGLAVIPAAIVADELADGRLQLLDTDVKLPPLTFSASWLSSPDTVAIERVAQLARQIAQSSVAVDAAATARH